MQCVSDKTVREFRNPWIQQPWQFWVYNVGKSTRHKTKTVVAISSDKNWQDCAEVASSDRIWHHRNVRCSTRKYNRIIVCMVQIFWFSHHLLLPFWSYTEWSWMVTDNLYWLALLPLNLKGIANCAICVAADCIVLNYWGKHKRKMAIQERKQPAERAYPTKTFYRY